MNKNRRRILAAGSAAGLAAAILLALKAPEAVERIQGLGQTLAPAGAEDFGRLIQSEYERWGRVVKVSGAKVE